MDEIKFAEVIGDVSNIKKVYWGTAPTGVIHLGYALPLLLICQMLDAGVEVIILLADMHAMLDSLKTTAELVESRCIYYETTLKTLLTLLGANTTKLSFVRGSSFQLSRNYTFDVYKMQTLITEHDAKKAGTEVVKQTDNPKLSSLTYPVLQALDEVYLKVDAELGGQDQRKIFTFASKYLPKIGYKPIVHLMNPMLPSLATSVKCDGDNQQAKSNKMSSSDAANSKITFTDTTEQLDKKIRKSFCEDKNVDDNPLLAYYEHIVIPLNKRLRLVSTFNNTTTNINGDDNSSDKLVSVAANDVDDDMTDIETLTENFKQGLVLPQQLKGTVKHVLESFLSMTRLAFNTEEYLSLVKNAYP